MKTYQAEWEGFTISTDPARLQISTIHNFLSSSAYWARGRTLETVEKSIAHSLCFGVYEGDRQVGFARIVSDYATFAWLCDVFILDSHRGKGLGKWLVRCVTLHPDLQGLKRILLATQDAHELYRQHGGFVTLRFPERWMERMNPSANQHPPTSPETP